MAKVHFIGDTHWGHKNILKYRPQFDSIDEHDNYILENILEAVRKRDTLYLMGDIIFDEHSIVFMRVLSRHIDHLHWVLGNHDSDNRKRQAILRQIIKEDLVSKVGSLFTYKDFWLSHAPIHPDELRGKRNIHGHVHSKTLDDDRYFNVCCENTNYKPVFIDELLVR